MIFNKIQELKKQGMVIGITFSQFDMLHAGHIAMLSEARNHCDYLIAGLQNNAKWDRPEKNEPNPKHCRTSNPISRYSICGRNCGI